MSEPRNWHDPKYKKWRLAVYKRDKFCCRLCGSKKKIQAHHIKRWADFPSLRFTVSNGITLCKRCHNNLAGQEDENAHMLEQVLNPDATLMVLAILYGENGDA